MSGAEATTDEPSIEEQLARELARVLEPLVDAVDDGPEGVRTLLEDADLAETLTESEREKLRQVIEGGVSLVSDILTDVFEGEMPDVGEVIGAIDGVYGAVKDLDDYNFEGLDDAGERLLDYLLVTYLDEYHHRIYSVCHLFGVIVAAETGPARIDLGRIPELFQDPGEIPKAVFGWAEEGSEFLAFVLLYYLKEFFWTLGLPASLVGPDVDEQRKLADVAESFDFESLPDGFAYELKVPVLAFVDETGTAVTGFKLVPLPGESNRLPGLALVLFGSFEFGESPDLGGGWTFNVRSEGELGERGFAVQPTKDGTVDVRAVDFGATDPEKSDALEASAELGWSMDDEMVLIGRAGASRVAVTSLSARVVLRFRPDEEFVVRIEVPTTGRLGVHPSDFDGFLAQVMPADGIFYD